MMKYPDHTLEKICRERGCSVQCMWQIKGPKNTQIAWIECFLIDQGIVLVETFKDGGWQVFIGGEHAAVDATVADVMERCKSSDSAARRKAA